MIPRPPRSTLDRSSAASDVYKRQTLLKALKSEKGEGAPKKDERTTHGVEIDIHGLKPVSYTHLRAHETVLDLVCRLLLEKTNCKTNK